MSRPETVRGVFVTGTDTGVGKTVITAAILSCLRSGGVDAVPMKPVQTGCVRKGGRWLAPDLEFSLTANAIEADDGEKTLMAPECFPVPCSPHLAASLAQRTLSVPRLCNAYRQLQDRHAVVVVEGAGGVLVPLNRTQTMLDLMVALHLPVVLVARPGLGTINHTLLSLSVLRAVGLRVLAVVINESRKEPRDFIQRDNIAVIRKMGRVRVLGPWPFMAGVEQDAATQSKAFRSACVRVLPPAARWLAWLRRT